MKFSMVAFALISSISLAQDEGDVYFPHVTQDGATIQSKLVAVNRGTSQKRLDPRFLLENGQWVDGEAWVLDGGDTATLGPTDFPAGTTAISFAPGTGQLVMRLEYVSSGLVDPISVAPVKGRHWQRYRIPPVSNGWLAVAILKRPTQQSVLAQAQLFDRQGQELSNQSFDGLLTSLDKGTVDLTEWLSRYPDAAYLDISANQPVAVTLLRGDHNVDTGWRLTSLVPETTSMNRFKLALYRGVRGTPPFQLELDGYRLTLITEQYITYDFRSDEELAEFFDFAREQSAFDLNVDARLPEPDCTPGYVATLDIAQGRDRNSFETDECRMFRYQASVERQLVPFIVNMYNYVRVLTR